MTVKTHESHLGGYLVSENDQWVPGVYATAEVARRATGFTDDQLESIAHIWRHDGQNRPATDGDLDAIEEEA